MAESFFEDQFYNFNHDLDIGDFLEPDWERGNEIAIADPDQPFSEYPPPMEYGMQSQHLSYPDVTIIPPDQLFNSPPFLDSYSFPTMSGPAASFSPLQVDNITYSTAEDEIDLTCKMETEAPKWSTTDDEGNQITCGAVADGINMVGIRHEDESLKGDPLVQKVMHDVVTWIQEQVKAGRLKGADFLVESSEETSIKIDFDTPDDVKDGKLDDMLEENDGESPLVTPKSSVTRGSQHALTRDILNYFTVEFPSLDDAISWAQSCPLSFEGSSIEIRKLQDTKTAVENTPADIRERTGDQMLATFDKELQEGNMKKSNDGTLWHKVELEEPLQDVLAEAEERRAQKEQE
ncbi:hypothetical protein E8E14_014705 [Neopestalotiopsis sp. 37M]|nr:hypothetical protein E8E14_014705 [Neopestalotiopsis sp. 37M]